MNVNFEMAAANVKCFELWKKIKLPRIPEIINEILSHLLSVPGVTRFTITENNCLIIAQNQKILRDLINRVLAISHQTRLSA